MADNGQKRKQFVRLSQTHTCQEDGSRIVNISLVDVDNVAILAIVGTEQRPRQMSYTVTEEFMNHARVEKFELPEKKWTSKNEAFGWLKRFLSNPPSEHFMPSTVETLSTTEIIRLDSVAVKDAKSNEDSLPRGVIEWCGPFTMDNKGSCHYGAFRRNGITVSAQSFIYVFTTHYSHLVAYIESLYETRNFKKKMRVIWLHKTEEINSENFIPKPHPKEVFMSVNHQALGLECFNGVATVLSWDHFERCKSVLPGQVMEAYVCRRLFHSDGHVETFDVGMLEGYWDQRILSMAGIRQVNKHIVKKTGPRKPRKRPGRSSFAGLLMEDKVTQRCVRADLENGFSRKMCSSSESDFEPDTEVEVLSEDSGLRGCWFRCHVLEKNSDNVKLKFQDVQVVDTLENLEEWHAIGTVAAAYEFRSPGRWTIRPLPPKMDVSLADEAGTAVDVQFEDCWCEGVLISHVSKKEAQVYLPEKKHIDTFPTSCLRISRDWVNGKWVDVACANLPKKLLPLHSAKISSKQDLKMIGEEPKVMSSDLESDITAAHQLSDSDVPRAETGSPGFREEVRSKCSKWSCKVSNPDRVGPTSSFSKSMGANRIAHNYTKLKQQNEGRLENRVPSKTEIRITGLMSKLPRKRRQETDTSTSAKSSKSLLFSLRRPMSNLVVNGLQPDEDRSLGWLSQNGKRDICEVELKHSWYGHEHAKPLSRSSAGGPLFNTVATANLVMSR